jgi:hypothetical protein
MLVKVPMPQPCSCLVASRYVNSPVPGQFRPALAAVVERLAAQDFEGLKRDGIDPNPGADRSTWIRDYGRSGATIVPLPEEAWEIADAFPIADRPGEWAVVVDLWTREEGRSGLSMEARVTESRRGVSVVIENIHVL